MIVNVKRREILICILLLFVTFGVYGIYWMIKVTNELNSLIAPGDTSGGIAFLLTIVTFGIYGIYWAYRLGAKLDDLQADGSSNKVLFAICQLFGLGIINMVLLQMELNEHATYC